MKPITKTILTAAALAAAAWPGATLRAEVTQSQYTNGADYAYTRKYVPDVDQRRNDLCNDGGCHCVPASCFNMLGYVVNWGFPGQWPYGPTTWGGQANYDEVTDALDVMGTFMFTKATDSGGCLDGCGTTFTNARSMLRDTLDDDLFDVDATSASGAWSPRARDVAQVLTSFNSPLVTIAYGRYDQVGTSPLGDPIYRRANGHAMTVVGALAEPGVGGERSMSFHNPGGETGSLNTQSLFATDTRSTTDVEVRITSDTDSPFDYVTRTMTRLGPPEASGRLHLLDAMLTVRLRFGYAWAEPAGVLIPTPDATFGIPWDDPFGFPSPGGAILDMVQDHGATGFHVLTRLDPQTTRLWHVRPRTGEATPGPTLSDARGVTRGRGRELLILVTPTIKRLDADGFQTLAEYSLPYPCDSIAYDETTGRVWVLSTAARKLVSLPAVLVSEVDPVWEYDLPPSLFLGDPNCDSPARLAAFDGNPYLVACNTNLVHRLTPGPFGASLAFDTFVPPGEGGAPGPTQITGIDVDSAGRLYVTEPGFAHRYEYDETTNTHWPRGRLILSNIGATAAPVYRPLRSRDDSIPGVHDTPEWENVDTELMDEEGDLEPVCRGDLNNDGTIDIDDMVLSILDFDCLGPPGACLGDANLDGKTDVDDVVEIVLRWGPCP